MDMACCAAKSESHGHAALTADNGICPATQPLIAQLAGVGPSILSVTPRQVDDAPPPAGAETAKPASTVDDPNSACAVEPRVPTPIRYNPILALFSFIDDFDAQRTPDPVNDAGYGPGLYHRPSEAQTLAARLLRYYATSHRRQQVFTALLGVSVEIFLLDHFLTATHSEAFTVNSLNALLSLEAVVKLNADAWGSLLAAEKNAVELLWRQCVKDELPIIYYAAAMGFGDVAVGQDEFAALFAGSLYLYQQKVPTWTATHDDIKRVGEALLTALVNETLELQLLGYLSLPSLFFAAQHAMPTTLNARQAANVEYKFEAIIQFKHFWRARVAGLKSANTQLRLYAESITDWLSAAGQRALSASAAPELGFSQQQEGDLPMRACWTPIVSTVDHAPGSNSQSPHAPRLNGVNADIITCAKAVAEHFCIIDRTLLMDAFARLNRYDSGQLCSVNKEIHEMDSFISEIGDYRSRNAYPHLKLHSGANEKGPRFATLKKTVDLLAVRDVSRAGKADHYKHIYAIQFQQSHYDIVRLDFDDDRYFHYDLFDIHVGNTLFEEMRRREQLVVNVNTPNGGENIIKPVGHQTMTYLIGYLQRKHRNALFASLHGAAAAPGEIDLNTRTQTLPLYGCVTALMAEKSRPDHDALWAMASALPAFGRAASLSARVAVTALQASRAAALLAGGDLPDGAGASVVAREVLPSRRWTINLGQDLLRLQDPGLNVLSCAGCASYAKATALLNRHPQPLPGGSAPPAASAGPTQNTADTCDFSGELPDFAVVLPMKVLGKQQHYLLLALVDVDSGEPVGRHYVCAAHHLILAPAASELSPAIAAAAGGAGSLAPAIATAAGASGPSVPAIAAAAGGAGSLAPANASAAGASGPSVPAIEAAGVAGSIAPAAEALIEVNQRAVAAVVTDSVKRHSSPRMTARTAVAQSGADRFYPSLPLLRLQREQASTRIGSLDLLPMLRPLTFFMSPKEFSEQRFDTGYINFCNMVMHYPDARAFYQQSLTQPWERVPNGYHLLRDTLPYFVNEVQLGRRYAHDLLAQFPLGQAFCAGSAASCHPIMHALAQTLRTRDKAILQQASARLGWYLAKINHYFDHYSDRIRFASRLPARLPSQHNLRALGFAHPADSERRCYIMVDNFIAYHFRRAGVRPQGAMPAFAKGITEGLTAPPGGLNQQSKKGVCLPAVPILSHQRALIAVADDYLDLYRQAQGDPGITVKQFIKALKHDEMLRANLIMEDKKLVARLIADLAHARHGALHPQGQRPFMLGERQAPAAASPAFLGMLYALAIIFDD